MTKPEIIPCTVKGCEAQLVCPPDQGPTTWMCPHHELEQVDAYWSHRLATEGAAPQPQTDTREDF